MYAQIAEVVLKNVRQDLHSVKHPIASKIFQQRVRKNIDRWIRKNSSHSKVFICVLTQEKDNSIFYLKFKQDARQIGKKKLAYSR
jgi:hypothetical protein